jgi:hypothetical protein
MAEATKRVPSRPPDGVPNSVGGRSPTAEATEDVPRRPSDGVPNSVGGPRPPQPKPRSLRPTSAAGRGARRRLKSALHGRSHEGRPTSTAGRGAPDPASPAHGECGRPVTRERSALKRRAPAAPAEAEATITRRRRTRPRVASYPRPERWNPSYTAQSLYIHHAASENARRPNAAKRCRHRVADDPLHGDGSSRRKPP